jgi:Ras-related protein Rab-18
VVTTAYFLCVNSLLLRFVEDSFDPDQPTTIGVDYKTKKVTVDDNTVKLGIWVNLLI